MYLYLYSRIAWILQEKKPRIRYPSEKGVYKVWKTLHPSVPWPDSKDEHLHMRKQFP